jgi:hypothetical protein
MGSPGSSRAAALVLCALALCTETQPAHAEETKPLASLEVSRTPEASDCPDAAGLVERVHQIAEKPVMAVAPAAARLSFSVALSKEKAGYAAVLRAKGSRSGVRNIADIGDDCTGLADALAVTLAIILDDEASTPPPEPAPLQSFPVATPPSPSRPPIPPPPAPSLVPRFFRPFVGVAATQGIFDGGALGGVAGLDIQIDQLVTGIGVLWLPPQRFSRGPGSASVDLLALGFHACFQPETRADRTHLALCAHFTEGLLHGEASGFSLNKSASRPWTAPGLGAIVGGEVLSPIEWFARAQVFVPLKRQSFVIDNVGTLHETPYFGGLAAIGLSLRIE